MLPPRNVTYEPLGSHENYVDYNVSLRILCRYVAALNVLFNWYTPPSLGGAKTLSER